MTCMLRKTTRVTSAPRFKNCYTLKSHVKRSGSSRLRLAAAIDSHRQLEKTLVQLSSFSSRRLSLSFGPAFRTGNWMLLSMLIDVTLTSPLWAHQSDGRSNDKKESQATRIITVSTCDLFVSRPVRFLLRHNNTGFRHGKAMEFALQAWKSHGNKRNLFASRKSHGISDFSQNCF